MQMGNHKSLRILMTADAVGGVWTYALELTRALEPYGVEVLLALMGPSLSPSQHQDARSISNLTLFKSDYKLEWMPGCWSDVKRAGDWLLHLENRLQPDLIHLNGYAHGSLPWNNPTLVAGHSCVFSWWRAVKGVAPTPERQRSNTEAREKRTFVLSAGRLWDEAKNIERVTEIASELPWPVLVAGDLQQRPLSNGCRWLGSLPETELRRWFAAAPIYALPARYEPFGYTPLEAALSGCALVLGDIESLREIWGDAAIFVDPNDSRALKSELLELINHPKRRDEMSDRARARALYFTAPRMGQNYFTAYQELLATRETMKKEELAQCA